MRATRHRTAAAGGTITAVVLTLALAVPAGAAGGSIDTSFGVGGDANLNVGNAVLDVLQKSDGTSFVLGNSAINELDASGQQMPGGVYEPPSPSQFPVRALLGHDDELTVLAKESDQTTGVFRDKADGSSDSAYGTDGFVQLVVNGGFTVSDFALGQDGSVVLAGEGANSQGLLIRLTAAGVLDATFNPGGITPGELPTSDIPRAVAIDALGRIVTACGWDWSTQAPCIARYATDGTLDATFGSGGRVSALTGTQLPRFFRLYTDANSDVLAVGTDYNTARALVVRLASDGTPDSTFGTSGVASLTVSGAADPAFEQLALGPDGGIWATGADVGGSSSRLFVTHLSQAGAVDAGFAAGGTFFYGKYSQQAEGVALDSAGNLLLGSSGSDETHGVAGVIRVTTGGITSPGNVAAAPTAAGTNLTWQPSTQSSAGSEVRWVTGDVPPATVNEGTAGYSGSATTAPLPLPAGTDVSVSIFTRDYVGAVSAPASLTLHGTRVNVTTNTSRVAYGATAILSLYVKDLAGASVGGAHVTMLARRHGTTVWVATPGGYTTDVNGAARVWVSPSLSTDYQFRFDGLPSDLHSTSNVLTVSVAPTVTAVLSRTTALRGTSVAVTGNVSPTHPGQPVYLQRFYNHAWHSIAKVTLTRPSHYRFVVRPTTRGTYRYRVYKPADSDHVSNQSRTVTLKVT